MSWLSDLSDTIGSAFTPDTMPAWGALAGLGQAATPHPGTGMGWGNALFGTIGDVSKGGMTGAQVGQEMTARDIGNQMSQLGLQKQQTLQPYQLAYLKSFYGGNPQGGAGGMPGSLSGISGHGSGKDGALTQADMLGLSMLSAAGASGDPGKISDAYKTLYEHNPDLAGAIKGSQEAETPQKMPNGQYQLGAGLFGSLAPQATSAALQGIVGEREPGGIGPGNQQPAETPTPEGAGQMMPPQGDALAAYRQQNGMQAPPIDAQRAGMGLPIGSSSPAQMPLQQGAPPPPQGQAMGQPIPAPPSPSQIPPQAQMQAQPPPQQGQPNPLQTLIAQQQAKAAQGGPPPQPVNNFMASDGKPIVPSVQNTAFFKPDPTGMPHYKTENTDTGVAATKKIQDTDVEADANMASSLNNTNQMLGRLHDIAEAYQTSQAGTLIAQYPDIANKLIGLGIIDKAGTVKDVGEFQRVSSDLITETMNQIKAANSGSSQSRILSSEFQGLVQKMADPHLQPDAIHDILGVSTGFANYNSDQVQGWNKIGGLGNRLANGYTLRPTDYERQFGSTHDLTDYINQAKQQMGPMKGEISRYSEGQTAINPKTMHKLTFRGGTWQ